MRCLVRGKYPADWPHLALRLKQEAGWWARYKGEEMMPVADAQTLFRRLWDVATLGKAGGER